MGFLLLFTFFMTCNIWMTNGAITCSDAYECQNQSLVESSSGSITCSGYFSCAQASLQLDVTANNFCNGAYSCYEAVSMYSNPQTFCYGLMSCAYVGMLESKGLSCAGELSCYGATTRDVLGGGSTNCDGWKSCMDANITQTYYFYTYGAYSAANALVYSYEGANYRLYGPYSMYNATIICDTGYTCTVECRANACNDLTLICEDGSGPSNGTCTFNVDCSGGAEKSDLCEDGYDIGTYFDDPDYPEFALPTYLLNETFSNYNNSVLFCNNATNGINVINCQDATECSGDYIDLNDQSICCTGTSSCENAAFINVTVDSRIDNNTAIRCDGYYSCHSIEGTINAPDGGDIYLAGWYSALGTGYTNGSISGSVLNPRLTNVYCTGSDSCHRKNISYCNNLYCVAKAACNQTRISNVMNNIYVLAWKGMFSTFVENVGNNVYCEGYRVCSDTTMTSIENNLIGNGYQVIRRSDISNVGNAIVVGGYGAINNCLIRNVSLVCVTHTIP